MGVRARRVRILALLGVLLPLAGEGVGPPAAGGAGSPGPLLRRLLAGPLAGIEEILFAVRVPGHDHWYANFGYYADDSAVARGQGFSKDRVWRAYGEGGRLCRLNLRTGRVTTILDDPRGGVRDPQVHYDGRKILFSYRRGGEHAYHLHEIDVDGTGLRQLTDGPDDDIEPTYCPDGSIVFGSSRCRRFVNCWYTRVTVLYACDADGGNIRMLSSNNDHDNTAWMLPDGRVLYMRWEYVDRSQVHFHHLWTMAPDGSAQSVFFGNQFPGIVMLDAKPIPGTDEIVASFSPGHGLPEHMGAVAIVDPRTGPDRLAAARQISRPGQLFRDPYPISEDCFLLANRAGIFAMDGTGAVERIFALDPRDSPLECHEPRPIARRPREPILPSRIDRSKPTGRLFLTDIYEGRNMAGVRRGEVEKLLILEQLPKPVNFSGGMEPLSIGGTFTLARVLGTVPVDPDGSAHFEVPALRSVFFVALDGEDLSVKRMQSFHTVMPGELAGCIGCHEHRTHAPPHARSAIAATRRPPDRIEPIPGVPDVFDFPRDIQPILDRHCLPCHDADRREGGVELAGDRTPLHSVSYTTIILRGLVADGRNLPLGNRAPRTIGSSASRLLRLIDGSHHGARPSARERTIVRLWIETSATYPGTYASLGCGMYPVVLPIERLRARCGACHGATAGDARRGGIFGLRIGGSENLQYACNLSRPEKSIILRAPLARAAGGLGLCGDGVFANRSDETYRAILSAIRASAKRLAREKRFDMPGFRPNEHYIREMQTFGILPADLPPGEPIDPYATDEAYWRSFWYVPPGEAETGGRGGSPRGAR